MLSLLLLNPQFRIDDEGRVVGVVTDGKLIEIKPHAAEGIFPVINGKDALIFRRLVRDSTIGFVNFLHFTVVHAISVEVDKKIYMLQ